MHPAYKADKPGIAPDCGMDLVPKYADEQASMATMPAGTVMISPEKQQLIGVRTGEVKARSPGARRYAPPRSSPLTRPRLRTFTSKSTASSTRSIVDYVGQLVKKGQPLFTLYSPDLVSRRKRNT